MYDRGNTGADPHSVRAQRYLKLQRDTWRQGINREKVDQSRSLYSQRNGRFVYVTDPACEPTGVALGHPLPSRSVTRRLWALTRMFERYLATRIAEPCLAFVRPDVYHVTIVSRTHFDSGEVHAMSPEEALIASEIIHTAALGEIQIDLHGLLLTRDGRLLARGFDFDDRLHRIRGSLARAWTQTTDLPTLAHVKLAHVLQPLSLEHTRDALRWLGRAGHHLAARLRFADVYTPRGRFEL